MQRAISLRVDEQAVADVVGPATYTRALACLRAHAVLHCEWVAGEESLTGTVHGRAGEFYATQAWFAEARDGAYAFVGGSCSCPVGVDCKHAAALVLSLLDDEPAREVAARPALAAPQQWSAALDALVGPPARSAPGAASAPALAVQLSLSRPRASAYAPRTCGFTLSAKLMRPGRKGWVAGDLSWSRLDQLTWTGAGYPPDQVRALRELYLLHRAGAAQHRSWYAYGHRDERSIDLSALDSRAWVAALADAVASGVRLLHARPALGELPAFGEAELMLDITTEQDGGLRVVPALAVDGRVTTDVLVAFLAEGHGAVLVDPESAASVADPAGWPLRLVRFTRPVPAVLHPAVRGREAMSVPAEHIGQFRLQYWPKLRALADLTSSDGSFAPPEVAPPTLVLRAEYGDEHALDLTWEWSYQVDGVEHRAALEPDAAAFRDPAAEAAALAELSAGPVPAGEIPTAGPTTSEDIRSLRGLDTMRFSTEVLPLLRDRPGLAVELSGTPADYREAGESLRIGVVSDDVAGETDWFDLGVQISIEDREVPFQDVFMALARGEEHLLLPDGAYFSLAKPALQALRRLIEEARALQERPDDDRLRISRYQVGLWQELAELGVIERQSKAWQRQVAGLLELSALPAPAAPVGLTAALRPYQLSGFQWLTFLWEHGLGGILADDMGLGKTLQSLALICHARAAAPGAEPFLIVAPTSVVGNWPAEAARFAPGLHVVAVTDTLRRSGRELADVVAGADVLVTSYTLLRLDIDAYADRDWSGLLLDEAQFVKNHQSKVYSCVRRLPAPFKLAITGTPMENNLMELWSLLSVGAPGLFPSPTRFKDHFVRPIEGRHGSAVDEGPERLVALRRRIRPLMLRRTKEQVAAELPPKQEQVLDIELHPKHRVIYDRRLQRERQKVLGLLEDMERNRFAIFRSLTVLRQLALHAGLVDDAHADVPSAKIDALVEHLQEVAAGGHRALVFSQFTGFLRAARERLAAEGVEYCYLDGRTRKRAEAVERFKAGTAPVFLISLKAGGFGLNLTEADYCFLLDPWWNPATEAQAIDRTHRIGQTRNVLVYRLIAAGTIEAKVRELAARKAELFADVMGDETGEAFSRTLSAADLRGLFS